MLQALDASERATLWRLLTRALHGAEPRSPLAPSPPLSRRIAGG